MYMLATFPFAVHDSGIHEGQLYPVEMILEFGTLKCLSGVGNSTEAIQRSFTHPWGKVGPYVCRVDLSGNSCCWIETGIEFLDIK